MRIRHHYESTKTAPENGHRWRQAPTSKQKYGHISRHASAMTYRSAVMLWLECDPVLKC